MHLRQQAAGQVDASTYTHLWCGGLHDAWYGGRAHGGPSHHPYSSIQQYYGRCHSENCSTCLYGTARRPMTVWQEGTLLVQWAANVWLTACTLCGRCGSCHCVHCSTYRSMATSQPVAYSTGVVPCRMIICLLASSTTAAIVQSIQADAWKSDTSCILLCPLLQLPIANWPATPGHTHLRTLTCPCSQPACLFQ